MEGGTKISPQALKYKRIIIKKNEGETHTPFDGNNTQVYHVSLSHFRIFFFFTFSALINRAIVTDAPITSPPSVIVVSFSSGMAATSIYTFGESFGCGGSY